MKPLTKKEWHQLADETRETAKMFTLASLPKDARRMAALAELFDRYAEEQFRPDCFAEALNSGDGSYKP